MCRGQNGTKRAILSSRRRRKPTGYQETTTCIPTAFRDAFYLSRDTGKLSASSNFHRVNFHRMGKILCRSPLQTCMKRPPTETPESAGAISRVRRSGWIARAIDAPSCSPPRRVQARSEYNRPANRPRNSAQVFRLRQGALCAFGGWVNCNRGHRPHVSRVTVQSVNRGHQSTTYTSYTNDVSVSIIFHCH